MAVEALLWLDLETTGSNETKDCIIEVGAILTTPELKEKESWSVVAKPTERGLGRLIKNQTVREMHEANGLYAEVVNLHWGLPIHEVEADILTSLREIWEYNPKTVMLAGSGVGHFDRRFLKAQMPRLDNFLHYACIDVGVVRRMTQLWCDRLITEPHNDRKTHRALDDVKCHLDEAREYADIFRAVAQGRAA